MQAATPDRRSRQMEVMSPRRLDALRSNGNNILGGKTNDLEAASNFKRNQDHAGNGPMKAMHVNEMIDNNPLNRDMDAEQQMTQQLHLVPCRWERSGWRYVQKDPQEHGFFKNPNRVNNYGVAPNKRRFASQHNRESFYKSSNASAFGGSNRGGATTYGQSFSAMRKPNEEQSAPWKQQYNKSINQQAEGQIQWAGESHARSTFKKTKDPLGDWTNVLFRA